MAPLATLCRASALLVTRRIGSEAVSRGFRTSSAALAAQNLTMPALSPTMTEGTIAAWRVKEGDKFLPGDVLLEIETDKATMDVEAQEEGVLMKIMQGDGSKGIEVGTRIAVIAEEDDDISQLEIPADETPKAKGPDVHTEPPNDKASYGSSGPAPASKSGPLPKAKAAAQKYPLYPSVAHLLRGKGIEEAAIQDITPTGPNGRLLKGDVLAYLGRIKAESPAAIEKRFSRASHLDLSNIKAAKAVESGSKKVTPKAAPTVPEVATLRLPISIAGGSQALVLLAHHVRTASERANRDLPPAAPSADDLFNQVLGLQSGPKPSRGSYRPTIASQLCKSRPKPVTDIIGVLAGESLKAQPSRSTGAQNSRGPVFLDLTVPKADVKRASMFFRRFRTILESELKKGTVVIKGWENKMLILDEAR